MIITVADPEWFATKGKLITYTRAFIKLYNRKNPGWIHKIYGMVEIKKWRRALQQPIILVILVPTEWWKY